MAEKEWWQKGLNKETIEDAEKQAAAARSASNRFYLKPNKDAKILFIDDEGVSLWEHQFTANGDFRNYTPCLSRNKAGNDPLAKKCPLCAAKNYPYLVGYFTIIDLTNKWKDWSGNKHENEIKLYPAKTDVLKKLLRRRDKRGSLVGVTIEVSRGSKKDSVVGSDFEILEEVDIAKLFPNAKPIDYRATVLQVMTVEQMEEIVRAGGAKKTQFKDGDAPDGESPTERDDEDIPY